MKKIRVFLTMILAIFLAMPVFADYLTFSKDLSLDPAENTKKSGCDSGSTYFDADFSYGTVRGITRCVNYVSKDQVMSQFVDENDGSMVPGPNCWCYLQEYTDGNDIDEVGLSSLGTLGKEYKSVEDCQKKCGCVCAESLASNSDFRDVLYSQLFYDNGGRANVTYSCGSGASGIPPVDSNRYAPGDAVQVPRVKDYCEPPSGKMHLNAWECVDAGEVVTTYVRDGEAFIITSNTVCTAQYHDPYHVTYACGNGTSGTAPTDSNGYAYGDTVTTKANTCTPPSGKAFAYWSCGGTNVGAGKIFTIDGDRTCTAQYFTPSFTATTSSISNNGTLNFNLSANGNYRVDCGKGGILSGGTITPEGVVSRGNTTDTMYTCTYNTAGTKTVAFYNSGTLSYNTGAAALSFYSGSTNANKATNAAKITAISGSLSTLFPTTSGNNPIFMDSFRGTSITTVPSTVFRSYATTGPNGMFKRTFQGCTSLTSIPNSLFSGITTGSARMFESTFQGCTGLTSLPSDLFANITAHSNYLFYNTFNGCSGLSGFISPTFFYGLISNGSQSGTEMMTGAFASTGLATSCASYPGMVQYTTPYDSSWSSKVSCIPAATISTSWYSNNNLISVNASEQSCTFGDVLSLPTAPERTGYTFDGWTVRSNNASCCPNLTSASGGTCKAHKASVGQGYTSGCNDLLSLLSVGQYVVKFANGTVWGDTLCSTTSGTNATVGLPESTAGANCWCKITSCSGDDINNCPTKSLWVFHSTMNSNNVCSGASTAGCPDACADAVKSNSTFRSAAFTAAGL